MCQTKLFFPLLGVLFLNACVQGVSTEELNNTETVVETPTTEVSTSTSTEVTTPTPVVVNATEFQTRNLTHDKAYIPSLYYTNVNNASQQAVANAKAALTTYQPLWDDLQDYYQGLSEQATSLSFLQQAKDWLTQASTLVVNAWNDLKANLMTSQDLTAAYGQVDSIRTNLQAWRKENKLNYLMDDLTTFDKAQAALTTRVQQLLDPARVTTDDLAAFANALTVLEPAWASIKTVTPDILVTQYHFSRAKADAVYQAIQAEGSNLADLNLALASGNNATALSAAQKIHPTFLQVFLPFGDFLTPFLDEMINMNRSYITVFLLTENNIAEAGLEKVQDALSDFEYNWKAFAAHYDTNKNGLNWQSYISSIETALANAKNSINAQVAQLEIINNQEEPVNIGELDLQTTHEQLSNISTTLLNLRSYENYPFVIDNLTQYSNAIVPIVQTFKVNLFSYVSNVAAFAEVANQAQNAAQALNIAVDKMDATAFGFDATKLAAIKAASQHQLTNLATFVAAINSNDINAANIAGQKVNSLFIELYKQFGTF